jgi:alkanesulfonate monooxygenase SsuD/methylene tetrahydromethanopterin reductase-like flavin-dependent oxidoreductase (luciferase family)
MSSTGNVRSRIGFNVRRAAAGEAVALIQQAEAAGVEMVWMTQGAVGRDAVGIFTAAAMRTERITLGTSIVPAFTRHPLALAGQVVTFEDLAPGRLRLGIGTSHGPSFARPYGAQFDRPLAQLAEYTRVLRTVLRDGRVQFSGEFYNVDATLPRAAETPVLVSALRENAWTVAGEGSDGGIAWLCPFPFLREVARPAIERGAAAAGRPAPPLIAHVPVGIGPREAVHAATQQMFGGYGRTPFYARMFAAAGYPTASSGELTPDLMDNLTVWGSEDEVAARLVELLDSGLDELLVTCVPVGEPAADEARLLRVLGRM